MRRDLNIVVAGSSKFRIYNISFDHKKKIWVGGDSNGEGPTLTDTSLSELLARIGLVIVVQEGWA